MSSPGMILRQAGTRSFFHFHLRKHQVAGGSPPASSWVSFILHVTVINERLVVWRKYASVIIYVRNISVKPCSF